MKDKLLTIFNKMHNHFGDLHWWPADTPFEVIIGAILTQNTAWTNVEKAIANLKNSRLMDYAGLKTAKEEELSPLIRPAGYYNQKAKKIKNFIRFLEQDYTGDLDGLKKESLGVAREKLLKVHGVGPETADSILLYALEKPIFVVDAYTKRIFSRHGFLPQMADYHFVQDFFMEHLPQDVKLFNEYHAQIVYTGKNFCRSKQMCEGCPLGILKGEG
ncbi:MAG: endonuclease III domain-containing protein [Candidatus Schekmanbacteria bacterium]|nr:endonuclease III domain-containing protein [Candidatus Schekmanbacteria bacterium]